MRPSPRTLRLLAPLALASALSAACDPGTEGEGGANVNDRTTTQDGEKLLTGAMTISADGRWALMQRNQTSVLVDIPARTPHQLASQVDRILFSKDGKTGYLVLANRGGVQALDLATQAVKWTTNPAFLLTDGAQLAKLTEDEAHLILGDLGRVFVLDTAKGRIEASVPTNTTPTYVANEPGRSKMLVVGTVKWDVPGAEHLPRTTITELTFSPSDGAPTATSVDIPNCEAPIVVVPGGTRAFLSPTFCEEGKSTNPNGPWTNPDPVSVIDLGEKMSFVRNLPGFGPVAYPSDVSKIVAFLDMKRIDESLFDNRAQIPSASSGRYHLMTIDPVSLTFQLAPIGNQLPRFAMTRDGKALLVDTSVETVRAEVDAKIHLGADGLRTSVSAFGTTGDSFLGRFDLQTQKFQPISGPKASLDRFVQTADGASVFTLSLTADGLGGTLSRIDTAQNANVAIGTSLRDIGILPDGKTLVLRVRKPAVSKVSGGMTSWYRAESYGFSLDGVTIDSSIEWVDSTPFSTGPDCAQETHDCQ